MTRPEGEIINPQTPGGVRDREHRAYREGVGIFNAIRSGVSIKWKRLIDGQPQVIGGFMNVFADHLPGKPPASMVFASELRAPQGFLNGHMAGGLYQVAAKALRDEGSDTDPMAYILEKGSVPLTASDMFAAQRLGRAVPWERDIPGPTLLLYLQELKIREEAATEKTFTPLPFWGQKEFKNKFTVLQEKTLTGLLDRLTKDAKKEGMDLIPFFYTKLALRPSVDDVIAANHLGDKIHSIAFNSDVIAGLVFRAAEELGINPTEVTPTILRSTRFRFWDDSPLYSLLHHAARNRAPGESITHFLQEPVRKHIRREQLIAQARLVGERNSTNGGEITYMGLRDAGLITKELDEVFPGGKAEFLEALGVEGPHTVFPTSPE